MKYLWYSAVCINTVFTHIQKHKRENKTKIVVHYNLYLVVSCVTLLNSTSSFTQRDKVGSKLKNGPDFEVIELIAN